MKLSGSSVMNGVMVALGIGVLTFTVIDYAKKGTIDIQFHGLTGDNVEFDKRYYRNDKISESEGFERVRLYLDSPLERVYSRGNLTEQDVESVVSEYVYSSTSPIANKASDFTKWGISLALIEYYKEKYDVYSEEIKIVLPPPEEWCKFDCG